MNKTTPSAYKALMAAAGLLPAFNASAQMPNENLMAYRYSFYEEAALAGSESDSGSEVNRYQIDVHQLSFELITGEHSSMNASLQYETLSGASPWYNLANATGTNYAPVVMSGASIEEARTDGFIRYAHHFRMASLGLSIGHSSENDYQATYFGADSTWLFNKKNTTLTLNVSNSLDTIEPTFGSSGTSLLNTNNGIPLYNDQPDHNIVGFCADANAQLKQYCRTENEKNSVSVYLGLSQILSPTTIASIGLGQTTISGYLSDPYKFNDTRPDNKSQRVSSVGLRQFFPALKGALHLDFRYYVDSWEVDSATTELGWAAHFGPVIIMPSVRYYEQSGAFFYKPYLGAGASTYYFSNDARLSPFTATSFKLKGVYALSKVDVHASVESYRSSADQADSLTLGLDNPGLVDFTRATLGFDVRF